MWDCTKLNSGEQGKTQFFKESRKNPTEINKKLSHDFSKLVNIFQKLFKKSFSRMAVLHFTLKEASSNGSYITK